MEATEKRTPPPIRRLLSTRSGTLALAAGMAALAAIVLIAFLSQYRESVRTGSTPVAALVADGLIPKGTSGEIVIGERLFKPTSLPQEQVKEDAVTDASVVADGVAVRDIYPGQQLVKGDFTKKADPVRGSLSAEERAVSLPLDTSHGLLGQLRTGDRVDVLAGVSATGGRSGAGEPVVRTVAQNVLVLAVPEDAAEMRAGKTADVTLRVSEKQSALLAYAADNGKVWLTLRPPVGASQQSKPTTVNLDALLAGSTPVRRGGSK